MEVVCNVASDDNGFECKSSSSDSGVVPLPVKLYGDGRERKKSIPPRRDPLASVVSVAGVVLSGVASAATTAPALENRDSQDLGSACTVTEPAIKRIAAAITEWLLLDVICMFR
jgi:hypothetical protein